MCGNSEAAPSKELLYESGKDSRSLDKATVLAETRVVNDAREEELKEFPPHGRSPKARSFRPRRASQLSLKESGVVSGDMKHSRPDRKAIGTYYVPLASEKESRTHS